MIFLVFFLSILSLYWVPSQGFVSDFCTQIQSTSSQQQKSTSLQQSKESDDDDERVDSVVSEAKSYNVLGTPLQCCCANVRNSGIGTGFYRNGFCSTGEQDLGRHTVCIRATRDFLEFSAAVGNDLSTPMPQWSFPGLQEGDQWCLCAQRWAQAYQEGMAPQLFLKATHEKTLSYVPLEVLMEYAVDRQEAEQVLQQLNQQRAQLEKSCGFESSD